MSTGCLDTQRLEVFHKLTSSTNATDLSGKVAVVTGAAAGLGRAEAIGLARAGATVVLTYWAAEVARRLDR